MKPVPLVLTICLTGMLAGCYPIYKTLQPSARVTVVDERGKPIEGAEVILITSSYPYGHERRREAQMTDRRGVAEFSSRSEWRGETLMLHGIEDFFWNWCVLKPGFSTHRTTDVSDDRFDRQPAIRLSPGSSSDCGEQMGRVIVTPAGSAPPPPR